MKFYKVNMYGPFYMNRGALPAWAATDEGRLYYDNLNKKVYYADNVHWVQISDEDNPGPAVYS